MKSPVKKIILIALTVLAYQFGMAGPLWAPVLSVDITITKEVDLNQAETGDTVTYTLTVTALDGPSLTDATDVVVTDTLPAGLSVVAVVAPGTYDCQNTSTIVTCTRNATMTKGSSDVIIIETKVADDVEDETLLENMAEATARGDLTPANNSSSVGVEINTCGNDTLALVEECDDGNTTNGDCCNSQCAYEVEETPCDEGNPFTRGRCDNVGFCELEELTFDEVIANSCQLNPPTKGKQGDWLFLILLGAVSLQQLWKALRNRENLV